MSTSSVKFLSAVLVVQLALGWVLFNASRPTTMTTSPMLADALSKADQIIITDADKKTLVLSNKSGSWALQDFPELPLSSQKLTLLGQTLPSFKRNWPVAETEIAARQFKVVDNSFERKLVALKDGKELETLFLGTSPSFKKSHAKLLNDKAIFEVTFIASDLSTKPSDWYDAQSLSLDPSKISAVKLGDIEIKRDGEDLTLKELPASTQVNKSAVADFIGKLSRIHIEEILTSEQLPADKRETAALEYKVTLVDNTEVTYAYFGPKEDGLYAVKSSKYPYMFQVRATNVTALNEIKKDKLLEPIPAEPAQIEASPESKIEPSGEEK